MKMILTGTGTSHGVPVIGCKCAVCTSKNPKNKRFRCSAYITSGRTNIVIDTGPEFRLQALKYNITKLDAVLITHSHADHLNGLDDVRIFSHTKAIDPSNPIKAKQETCGTGLPIYTNAVSIKDIKNRFDYVFMPVKEGGGKPKINLIDCSEFNLQNPIRINDIEVIPVPLLHGSLNDTGWLLTCTHKDSTRHSIAYLTDTNFVPEESINLIKNSNSTLEHLVIDGLRKEKHSTHFSFREALGIAEILKPKNTYLTHITHNMSHKEIEKYVLKLVKSDFPELEKIHNDGGIISPAYDGLILKA